MGSQLRGNPVLCAEFVDFLPCLYVFRAPNYAVTACCVQCSFISHIFAPFLGTQLRGNRVLCAEFVHFLHICVIFGLPTRGNRVPCAEFVHFAPYLHYFWAPNYAVTACCVQSLIISFIFAQFMGSQLRESSLISYHVCTFSGLPTTR